MAGAAAGLILGTILLGPIGILIGPFVLVILISLLEKKRGGNALKIGLASTIGIFSSTVVKFLLQIMMITWFLIIVL